MVAHVKFICLSLLLLIAEGVQANAQSSYYIEPQHITFDGGIIFGTNFTQVDGDTYSGYNKIGINAGGVVYVHFTHSIGVSMELLYSQKGSRGMSDAYSTATNGYISRYGITINYVEAPLLLHSIVKISNHDVDLEGGVSYGRLIHASEWVVGDQLVIIDPIQNRFNNTDLNYILGASTKLYKKLYINARYQYSIIPIRPTDRVPVGYSYGSKGQFNNLCVLRLMYYF